jgi:hypothetical protein
MLLISSSEDRYDLSYSRVPAHVLPYSFSGTAVLSWLAPSPAFPLTSKETQLCAPSAQATHATGLPFLPSGQHSLAECETCLCTSTPLE